MTKHGQHAVHIVLYNEEHALMAMNAFCALVLSNGSTAMIGAILVGCTGRRYHGESEGRRVRVVKVRGLGRTARAVLVVNS